MKNATIFLVLMLCTFTTLQSQNGLTANEHINEYTDHFRQGINPGWYQPWTDEQLGQISMGDPANGITGAGVKSMRPGMFEYFYEYFGYDFRVPTYAGYDELGAKNNVGFIGYPSDDHRDFTEYCEGQPSWVFDKLYDPIWVYEDGEKVVNRENHFAKYVYELVTRYGDYVGIWEVWNEPDYDFTGNGWKPVGMEGNWWENDPAPCDYALQAPIYHYVRMLRIAYEVIHTYDDDAYVAVGGIGYASFLDAVLRNTDNPVDGSLSDFFPKKGGAYFDVLSFHYYPHIDATLREWSNDIMDFNYFRHSDRAADGIVDQKGSFEDVLIEHGYDGATYPEKIWICTETNIPRKKFGNFIGSEMAQRNFITKVMVKAQMHDIQQVHLYNLGEFEQEDAAVNEFQLMGLYKDLTKTQPFQEELTEGGVAFKTTSDLLFGKRFDKEKTNDLQLPPEVDGGVFVDEEGKITYVLWAKTFKDDSEDGAAIYSFPSDFPVKKFEKRKWNFSGSNWVSHVGSRRIRLRSSPVFLTAPPENAERAVEDTDFLESNGVKATVFNTSFESNIGLTLELEDAAEVSVQLVDRSARVIDVAFTNRMMDEGVYDLEVGNDLISGIYFVQIMVGNKMITKKIFRTRDN